MQSDIDLVRGRDRLGWIHVSAKIFTGSEDAACERLILNVGESQFERRIDLRKRGVITYGSGKYDDSGILCRICL